MVAYVIFDCDGVLVDSELLSARAMSEAMGAIGLEVSPEECLRELLGRSLAYSVEYAGRRLGRPAPASFADDYRRRLYGLFRAELRPVAGVTQALDAIGLPRCVASSGEHERIRVALEATGLLDRFDGRIFSATDVARGKPAPDLFLHAAAQMGWEPRHCAVVEDSPIGVEAGRAAGMAVLAYAAATGAEALAARGGEVFASMAELPELIARLAGPGGGRHGDRGERRKDR
jgi:HAD superfamily hydrolase (TIGR01509 family)